MIQRYESYFTGSNQLELFVQRWKCPEPRGTIVLTHGMAEHSDCYHELASKLCGVRWNVVGWDLRGHGRSEGKRGYINQFSNYVGDLRSLIQHLMSEDEVKNKPFALFGHSMGGLISLLYCLDYETPAVALTLSSPALGLAIKIPPLKEKIAHFASKWAPRITLYNEIKYIDLSRDERKVREYSTDTLRHDKISPGVFIGMLEGFEQVRQHASEMNLPVLMQLAGNDKIVSSERAQEVFQLMPNKKNKLFIYPDSLHEIYNDLDKEEAFEDLKVFLQAFQES